MKKAENGLNTNLSYLTLRKLIGWLGLLLPLLVAVVAWQYDSSISHYFYTRAGVVFTSTLTLCGAFLISYRGNARKEERLDYIITWIGGVLLLVVAFVPTLYGAAGACDCGNLPICHCSKLWGGVHFGSAALAFVCMGYMAIFRFRRGDKPFSPRKKRRNKIYLVTGIAMWVILAFAGVVFLFFNESKGEHFVFWIEVALLLCFGISWLVKGKALKELGL